MQTVIEYYEYRLSHLPLPKNTLPVLVVAQSQITNYRKYQIWLFDVVLHLVLVSLQCIYYNPVTFF